MLARRSLHEGGSIFFPAAQFEEKRRKSFVDRRFASASMPRAREMRFFVAGADVDLHVLVANAAENVTAKFVAAEFAAGRVTVEDPDLAAGPSQRRFLQSERFG